MLYLNKVFELQNKKDITFEFFIRIRILSTKYFNRRTLSILLCGIIVGITNTARAHVTFIYTLPHKQKLGEQQQSHQFLSNKTWHS